MARVRRTQAERSAATRDALVRAAVELMIERGWAATTAVAVCERADCTRGALVHHYPSLSGLLTSALEALHADLAREPSPEATTMSEALAAVWRAVSDPRFKAVLEAWLAAANDPSLATEIHPAMARFAKLVSPDNANAASPLRHPDARSFFLVAREAMMGLAVGRAINRGVPLPQERAVLRRLRAEAARFDEAKSGT